MRGMRGALTCSAAGSLLTARSAPLRKEATPADMQAGWGFYLAPSFESAGAEHWMPCEQDDSSFLGATYTLHLHRSKGYGDGVRGYGIQFEPREPGPTVTLVRAVSNCSLHWSGLVAAKTQGASLGRLLSIRGVCSRRAHWCLVLA